MDILEQHNFILAQVNLILAKLRTEAKANAVALIDKNGRLITKDEDTYMSFEFDVNYAVQGLKSNEEVRFMKEGTSDSLYIVIAAEKFFLLVLFDMESSLNLVRLKAKTAIDSLKKLIEPLGEDGSFASITDEDIDDIFSYGAINF